MRIINITLRNQYHIATQNCTSILSHNHPVFLAFRGNCVQQSALEALGIIEPLKNIVITEEKKAHLENFTAFSNYFCMAEFTSLLGVCAFILSFKIPKRKNK